MCGIAGILRERGSVPSSDLLERMLDRLEHRGPDGRGVWTGGRVGLAHARLAIIDLAGGAQPMANEDGTVRVTFNGEIYNHRELRKELGAHTFATRSDTEVLVHLYEEHGPAFVEKLHGFFAFALWDARRERLVLARDGLGKKPLYVARTGVARTGVARTGVVRTGAGDLVFASEVGAVLAALPEAPEVDPFALNDALALRYVRPGRSGLKGVESVLPGEVWTIEGGETTRRRFWQPPWPDEVELLTGDEDALVAQFRERFDAAVACRLESDVPLGLLLSGGIDSTAVLESLSRQATGKVRTFTVGFSREEESEAGAAREAAEYFGTRHIEFSLTEADMLEHLERIVCRLDEPFGDPSFLPTALISETARREVTVCLTGDGGDELFGGYNRYRQTLSRGERTPSEATLKLQRWLAPRLPRYALKGWKLARRLDDAVRTPEEAYVARLVSTDVRLRSGLLGPRAREAFDAVGMTIDAPEQELLADLDRPGPLAARMMALDERHYLPGLILTKADRASMLASLEVRSPFLDTGLVEWAARVPLDKKLQADGPDGRGTGKRIVRRALEGRVPSGLFERKKQGFGTPLGRWFRRELGAQTEDYLMQSRLAADGWLEARTVRAAVRAHKRRARNLGELLWTLLCLEAWYRTKVMADRTAPLT
jgi:asparagine synthase (glutamine-hydrolysing)